MSASNMKSDPTTAGGWSCRLKNVGGDEARSAVGGGDAKSRFSKCFRPRPAGMEMEHADRERKDVRQVTEMFGHHQSALSGQGASDVFQQSDAILVRTQLMK